MKDYSYTLSRLPELTMKANVRLALDLLEIWYKEMNDNLNLRYCQYNKSWPLRMKTKGLIAHDRALVDPMFGVTE